MVGRFFFKKYMLEFLPYYSEIRLGGHIACAYLATIVGIVGLYIGRILGKSKISSGAIALFSITLSGLLWVIAFLESIAEECREPFALLLLILCFPILKIISLENWKQIFAVWFCYVASQIWLYWAIYYFFFS